MSRAVLKNPRAVLNNRRCSVPLAALLLATFIGISPLLSAQQKQPDDLTGMPAQPQSSGRIAPAGEPGTPLILSGTVVAADGTTPLAGVVVYAYHTDATGHYVNGGVSIEAGENHPRLRGWVKTDANGHFEFTTIRPAPYPNRDVPAHVHIHVWGAGYPRQWFEVEFQGDPLLSKQHFSDNTADYLYIVPLASDPAGAGRCTVTIRMRKKSNF
jgi:protocatechuate 3,4-dioxygenase beta subunit